jgi:hypothetical protein
MTSRSLLTLALISALSIGCTTATAQEGEDPREEPRRELSAEEKEELERLRALRHVEGDRDARRRAEAEAAYEEALRALGDESTQGRERAELHLRLARLEASRGHLHRAIENAEHARRIAPDWPKAEETLDKLRHALAKRNEAETGDPDSWLPRGRGRPGPGRRGPGPRGDGPRRRGERAPRGDMEERLERLERAVRDMHEMLSRHGVDPEARERARREMQERERRGRRGGDGPRGFGRRGERGPGPRGSPRPYEYGVTIRPTPPAPGLTLAAERWFRRIDEAQELLRESRHDGAQVPPPVERAAGLLADVAREMSRAARGPRPGVSLQGVGEDGSKFELEVGELRLREGAADLKMREAELARRQAELDAVVAKVEAERAEVRRHVAELEHKLKAQAEEEAELRAELEELRRRVEQAEK